MSDSIQDEFVSELLEAPLPCCLSSLDPDGRPYGVVVWCAPEGKGVTVNAAEGLLLRNLERDPPVSLVVVDTGNILRHVSIQGRVTAIEEDRGHQKINRLSETYEGLPYRWSTPDEVPRFKLTIEPERVRTLDPAAPEEEAN